MIDLDELQKLAEAAQVEWDGPVWEKFWDQLSEDDLLQLIERVRVAEVARDAAVAAIERVRDALKAERAWHEHLVESGEAAPRNAIGIGVVEKALDGAPEPEVKP